MQREGDDRSDDRKVGRPGPELPGGRHNRRPVHRQRIEEVEGRPVKHRPGEQAHHRHAAPGGVGLHHVGDRGGEHPAHRQHDAEADIAFQRRGAPFMDQQQRHPRNRHQAAAKKAALHLLADHQPREQGIGHHQEGEHHRDDAGGDVALGVIDEQEVARELRDADKNREDVLGAVQAQAVAHQHRQREHRGRRQHEAEEHPPGRRHPRDLPGDDEPCRSPDRPRRQEGDQHLRAEHGGRPRPAHSAAIALPSAAASSARVFQAVTKRAESVPQS